MKEAQDRWNTNVNGGQSMIGLTGQITIERDKAIAFKVTSDEENTLAGHVIWLPKSQVRIVADEIIILVPRWLHESKVERVRKQGGEQSDHPL